ncbi:MAG: hypothetical protein WDW36_008382 [Sanguina aurantia]
MQRHSAVARSTRARPLVRRSPLIVRAEKPGPLTKDGAESNSKLNQDQLNEVGRTQVGDISPQKAEMRADMGNSVSDPMQMQAFDGPAPGLGIKEQIADHPFAVIASFVIIAIATHVPLSKGVTRKEAYENGIWTAKTENYNGRVAMMGFLALIVGEAISGVNTLQLWGLQ